MQRISVSSILIAGLLVIGVPIATLPDVAGNIELRPASYSWTQQLP
jgi:hypothetical protein